jgi:hypothetical protein
VTGAALEEIAARTGTPRFLLADVLDQELKRGRVRRDYEGRYELVRERFDANVLAALDHLEPPDFNGSRPAEKVQLGARPWGALARSFS